MYSGQNAQKSAVSAAAGGVSNKRASRHAKNGIAAESAHHSTAPPTIPPVPSRRASWGGQQYVGPRRKEGVGPLQAGALLEPLGPLDVRAHVRVEFEGGWITSPRLCGR